MFVFNNFSTCFGHHYAHLQANKTYATACGVLRWFCWMWLVAVAGRCLVGCEHCEGYWFSLSLHNLLTMHGHRNIKQRNVSSKSFHSWQEEKHAEEMCTEGRLGGIGARLEMSPRKSLDF